MEISQWISPLNFHAIQQETLSRRVPGTGTWLLENIDFCRWIAGDFRFLWCAGNRTRSSTRARAMIVEHLQMSMVESDVAVVCIFCNYKRQSEQTPVELVATILKQLIQGRPFLSDHIISLHRKLVSQQIRPFFLDLLEALRNELLMYSRVYLVVDAFDECSEATRAKILAVFRTLTELRILITSRDISSIAQESEDETRINIRARNEDLRTYIEARITAEPRLARHLKGDIALKQEIIDRVSETASGMFLLARLHMDSLASKSSRKLLRLALNTLPKEINDSYDETMTRIAAQGEEDRELAHQVFSWLAYCQRPLTVQELQHALAVSTDTTEMDLDAIVDLDILTSVCAGLVVIDDDSNIIRLVHYTTQEYFELKRTLLFPDAQTNIAIACISYLSFDVFSHGYSSSDSELEALALDNTLLQYASRYWGIHGKDHQASIFSHALDFLQNPAKVTCAVQVFLCPPRLVQYRVPGYSQMAPQDVSGAHIAAMFGLHETLELLLDLDPDAADCLDGRRGTPLLYAAERGHLEVVRLLLARNSRGVDHQNQHGWTPLSMAAWNGHESIVKLLLQSNNVNIDAVNHYHRTALSYSAMNAISYASRYGRVEVVELLLQSPDIQPDIADDDGFTPLIYSARGGHELVSRRLLEHGNVRPDAREGEGKSVLAYAAGKGSISTVELLLNTYKVPADSKDNFSRTPLCYAVRSGRESVVRILVEREDVDLNWKDRSSKTPLSCALEYGYSGIAQLLREKGVEEVSDVKTPSIPWYATDNGHALVVKMIQQRTTLYVTTGLASCTDDIDTTP
ncbi:ankyrin repeat-containing domain protein [Mycena floridula]|nr:ankyrin repeat-containing domain protein [Mycena floridula]